MSIEKHQCEGGDFHTTTDFLDCECGAIIPQPNRSGGIVECGSCKATNFAEDLADARVEEIVQAVANANDPTKVVPENCVAIGESRMLELEEKETRYDELHGHWLRLIGTKVILRRALEKAKESLDYVSSYLDKEDSETVVESVDKAIEAVEAALRDTAA